MSSPDGDTTMVTGEAPGSPAEVVASFEAALPGWVDEGRTTSSNDGSSQIYALLRDGDRRLTIMAAGGEGNAGVTAVDLGHTTSAN